MSVFLRTWPWACICSSYSCIRGSVLAYAGKFLSLCVRGNGLAYAGSWLHTWALTYIHEMPGRSLALPIFTYFSTVSLPHAILTLLLSFLHSIIIISFFLSSFLHQNIIFSKFYLNQESNVIFFFLSSLLQSSHFFFFFFASHHSLIRAGEALIRWWSSSTFLSSKPRAIFKRQALSLSSVFFWRSL